MYKVATLNKISKVGLDELTDKYTIVENTADAEGIVVRSQDMKSMDFSNGLLCISRAGVGVNNIPLDKCSEKGIVVFNTPGANANAVKELVIGAMLIASRNLVDASNWASGLSTDELTIAKQVEKGKSQFKGSELKNRTLGIIGLGGIGGQVANAAVHLGMKVIGYDAYLSVSNALHLSKHVDVVEDIGEMLPYVDFLTVHVHANSETNGMINDDIFSRIKPGAVLLNYARGSVVDTASVKKALEQGVISRYICDFPNDETVTLPNTVLTPHLGASTEEAEDNCAVMAVQELMDYIENGNITNSVNFPNVHMGKCKAASRIALLHRNVPNMISRITGAVSEHNISDMINRNGGDFAYTVLDLDSAVSTETIENLRNIDGVVRLRIIK